MNEWAMMTKWCWLVGFMTAKFPNTFSNSCQTYQEKVVLLFIFTWYEAETKKFQQKSWGKVFSWIQNNNFRSPIIYYVLIYNISHSWSSSLSAFLFPVTISHLHSRPSNQLSVACVYRHLCPRWNRTSQTGFSMWFFDMQSASQVTQWWIEGETCITISTCIFTLHSSPDWGTEHQTPAEQDENPRYWITNQPGTRHRQLTLP